MEYTENNFVHKTEVQIRFNDADIAGHVNNAVYQHYYDLAKLKYFNEVLGEQIDLKQTILVLANINIDFFKPIYLEDKIVVLTKVFEIGNKSLKVVQEIISDDAILKSRNNSVMVGFDIFEKKSVEIPDYWKSRITSFEKKVVFKYPQINKAD